ncbi:hypothetical protein UA75_06710 [Actinoalloteichus sp. GBA129-24]|uniref:UvrA interaction domain-containing protein n=1 Tax=Actinoalloteichus fjordicus TaxID=1612552 RepID=A0AAC9L8L9_9PSEU|nr:hypothetical protein UA74_06710 [Actinoalloteichus fjordicus]APU19363.1 hypothetical protein UA75_06710 [Actinoalloteichus sp. GBA129-24]
MRSLTDPPKLEKQEKRDIEVVIDRLAVTASAKQRLMDSVETALRPAGAPARVGKDTGDSGFLGGIPAVGKAGWVPCRCVTGDWP